MRQSKLKRLSWSQQKNIKAIKEFKPGGETYSYKFGDGKASKKIAEIIKEEIVTLLKISGE